MSRARRHDPLDDAIADLLAAEGGALPAAAAPDPGDSAAWLDVLTAARDQGADASWPAHVPVRCPRCGTSRVVTAGDVLDAAGPLVGFACPRCRTVTGGPVGDVARVIGAALEDGRTDPAQCRRARRGRNTQAPAVTLPYVDPVDLLHQSTPTTGHTFDGC